ncbi:putative Ig domain-containing protein [Archangium sp.]|uniref:putative Ig domain-containing protein n=1 Tax=Archangium sp. TaxID=1872627 RepID=UPI002D2B6D91|nr:putative Ig domain-containing protein [Archangium sp.]HYO58794.1 putative Ig domain-containing protein [Archangium sp.]
MVRTQVVTAWVTGVLLLLCACDEVRPPPGTETPLAISTESLPRARQGEPYDAPVDAQGGAGAVRAWSLVEGTLPEGLALVDPAQPRLRIVGTPKRRGSHVLSLSVEDERGQRATRSLQLEIDSSLAIGELPLADGTEGQPYTVRVGATGGSGESHHWSVASGELPPGLTLQGEGNVARLSGTPGPGRFRFTLVVEDSEGTRAERPFELVVRSSLAIRGELPIAARTRQYETKFEVTGGLAPYRWTLVGAEGPGGLRLGCTPCGAVGLSGVPTAAGSFPLVLRVEDANGGHVERTLSLRVVEPLELISGPLTGARRAVPYSTRLEARGGSGEIGWSITSGALPPGLTLTGEGGTAVLQGTPSKEGSFEFTVFVKDPAGFTAERTYVLGVSPNPPRILTASLPGGDVDQPYETVVEGVTAVGGTVRWKIVSGWLPPGVVLPDTQAARLSLSGVTRVAGTFTVTLELSDDGGTAQAKYTVHVGREPRFELRSGVLPPARAGEVFSASVRTVSAQGAVSGWTVAEGALPEGLALVPRDDGGAFLRGTPATAGFYRFALQATDEAGHTSRKSFVLQVAPARRWAALTHNRTFSGPRTTTVVDLTDRSGQTRWDVGSGSEAYDFTFSPDGAWLSYTNGGLSTKSLYLADLRTPASRAVRVSDNLRGDRSGPVSFSPDGRWMVYAVERTEQRLSFDQYARDLSGSGGTIRLNPSWATDHGRSWSPDGTRVIFESSDATMFRLWDTRGTFHTLQVTPELRYIQWPLVWTPDSRGVVFGATEPTSSSPYRFYYLDLTEPDTARPIPLTPPDVWFNPNLVRVAPDGSWLSFTHELEGKNEIYVLDLGLSSFQVARKVSGALSGSLGANWSSDSRHLLITQGTPVSVYGRFFIADAEGLGGSEPTPLVTPGLGPATGFATWAADGAHVAYTSAEGLSLVRAIGEPSVMNVTASPVGLYDYVFLPGAGRRLVYADKGLYLFDPDRPPEQQGPVRLDTAGHMEYFSSYDLQRTGDLLYFNLNGGPHQLWWVDLRGAEPTPPLLLLDFADGILSVRTF